MNDLFILIYHIFIYLVSTNLISKTRIHRYLAVLEGFVDFAGVEGEGLEVDYLGLVGFEGCVDLGWQGSVCLVCQHYA
jgi:hypothetical protein